MWIANPDVGRLACRGPLLVSGKLGGGGRLPSPARPPIPFPFDPPSTSPSFLSRFPWDGKDPGRWKGTKGGRTGPHRPTKMDATTPLAVRGVALPPRPRRIARAAQEAPKERRTGNGRAKKVAATAAAGALLAIATDAWRFVHGLKPGAPDRWNKLVDNASHEGPGKDAIEEGEPTVIYDVRGRVVATLSGEQVALGQVADEVWQAVVSSEDRNFFEHRGVDVKGIARAVLTLGRSGGGSTITQQLVKNALLSQDRSISRKAVEMAMSLVLETKLSKPNLLEHYLNNVYWGHGVYGIASAAAAYFRKKPSELKLEEASLLASLLPGPEWLSPYNNPQGALRARAEVLRRMAMAGYIEDKVAEEIASSPLPGTLALAPTIQGSWTSSGGSAAPYRAPFFVSEVLFQLQELLGPNAMYRKGGLQIHTTLDLGLQERAEELVKEDGETLLHNEDKGEAALVAMEPGTGAVRVLVGGRNYASAPYNRAVLARRSPGSAFKPFVFLAALASGKVTPSTEVEDEEVIFHREARGWKRVAEEAKLRKKRRQMRAKDSAKRRAERAKKRAAALAKGEILDLPDSESEDDSDSEDEEYNYRPQNYSRKYKGTVSLRDCLADSLNIPTVKLCGMIGIDKVIEMAKKLGVKSPLPHNLSLALGACEVTPLEITTAYNTIAAKGIFARPHLITLVKEHTGTVLYKFKPMRKLAVQESACLDLHRMLRAAVTKGTGRSAALGWQETAAAGKTGTSDDYRDAWFAGYTPNLTCVVWVGRDNSTSLPGTGATLAAPLWARFMRAAQGSGIKAEKGTKRRKVAKWREMP